MAEAPASFRRAGDRRSHTGVCGRSAGGENRPHPISQPNSGKVNRSYQSRDPPRTGSAVEAFRVRRGLAKKWLVRLTSLTAAFGCAPVLRYPDHVFATNARHAPSDVPRHRERLGAGEPVLHQRRARTRMREGSEIPNLRTHAHAARGRGRKGDQHWKPRCVPQRSAGSGVPPGPDHRGRCRLSLYTKRLERGRFVWPSTAGGAVLLSAAQLGYLLEGIDWRNPVRTWRPLRAG